MLLTNVRCLTNKFDETSILCYKLKPNFIVVSETWLDPVVSSDLFYIPNYSLVRCDRSAHGGGIGIWSREEISLLSFSIPILKSNILAVQCSSLEYFINSYLSSLLGKLFGSHRNLELFTNFYRG